ncbi:TPA: phage portal protein [Clostridium perfringens]|uniref:phage portal protein n=1 Tax=Clostridium perfringens TaxID=1502 RepID=UPI001CCAE546|nr:phage portal protein [Clostridium perfringens]UBK45551.1 phage portal protein [Clostridium perfringens]UBK54408.1 phage portal protein [Clostridium perfringens]UBK83499.1 phage portal protein [Clostridium perfringens]
MAIDIENVKKLREKFDNNLNTYKKMDDYYLGKTDILSTYKKSKIGLNRKVNVNFIKKMVDEEVSFAVGNPISYVPSLTIEEIIEGKSVQDSVIESNLVNLIMKENVNVDAILCTNMLKFGQAYEHYYWKDNKFKIKEYDPLSIIAELDEEDEVISALRVFKLDDIEYMDYFTDKEVIRLDTDYNIVETTPHYFGFCPIAYGSQIGCFKNTIYNDIKALQDQIEGILSDLSNEIGDSRLSYLILKNISVPEEIKAKFTDEKTGNIDMNGIMESILMGMRDNAILNINSNDEENRFADINYLIKNVNAEMHINALNMLIDLTYQISQHINLNDKPSSNTSGVALQTRIISLRNKVKMQQNYLTKVIKKRIKAIITMMIKNYNNKELNYEKVGIVYNMNVPSDDAATTDIITKLVPNGIMSAEEGLARLSFITNPKSSYEKAQEEFKTRLKGEQEAKESIIGNLNEHI